MDTIDKKILEILSADASISGTEISHAVNLSVPAVNKRIQKLQKDGIIRAFTVLTDKKKVSKPVIAFILIVVKYNSSGIGDESLLKYVRQDPDVLECYAVTGEYDYIVKVCAEDVEHLEDKLLHLKRQVGVVKSHTMLSLKEQKFQPTLLPDLPQREDQKAERNTRK